MAKGGSGDLLAGLIAGIAASKHCKEIIDSAALGVYLHSLAGESARNKYSENAMTISNVSEKVVDQKTLDRRQSIKEKIDFLRDRINE